MTIMEENNFLFQKHFYIFISNFFNMGRGADWAKNYSSGNRSKAMKVTKNLKCKRKGKKFKVVKICDCPPTWKEVEVD